MLKFPAGIVAYMHEYMYIVHVRMYMYLQKCLSGQIARTWILSINTVHAMYQILTTFIFYFSSITKHEE